MEFDYKQYGAWMDKNELRSETINFMLLNPEIFTASEVINARTYTMFANAISGFKKFDDTDVLRQVECIAEGCFGKDTTVGALFVTFVNNNLDKLMDAEEIITGEWKDTMAKIKENVYQNGNYRADIASVLTTRLINYADNCKDGKKIDKLIDRIPLIVDSSDTLLTEDLMYELCRKINKKYTTKCSKLYLNPKIRSKLLD